MSNLAAHPCLTADEIAALSSTVARLGRPAPAGEPSPPSQAAIPGRAAPGIAAARAQALADQLPGPFGYRASEPERAYLAGLLRLIPDVEGGLVQVLHHGRQALHEQIAEADTADDSQRPLARMALRLIDMAGELAADPLLMPWFDGKAQATEVERLSAGAAKELSDADRDYLRFLQKVEAAPPLRRRCVAPAPSVFLDLVARFPNFAQPLQFLAEQAAIAALRAEARFDFMPLLLTGPAGVGKTHFVMALAKVLATSTEVLSMASQSCGFALAGMDRGWSTARAGLVFNALLHGETMSPIIVLDELDKANLEGRSDPLGPLYTLLEPRSASEFRDEFAGFPVDASQVLWLATANDSMRVPVPLLSRFKVFDIAPPTRAQALAIARNVYKELSAGLLTAPESLPESWSAQFSDFSVREMRMHMQQALGCAALRAVLGTSAMELRAEDLQGDRARVSRHMGFL